MAKQTMSEIIAEYNALAVEKGVAEVESFKNLKAATTALAALKSGAPADEVEAAADDVSAAPGLDTPNHGGAKYNSVGKRGPTQGVGKFAKELLATGMSNAEVLEQVKLQFPTAKTSLSCIAFYRNKLAVEAKAVEASDDATEEATEATEA